MGPEKIKNASLIRHNYKSLKIVKAKGELDFNLKTNACKNASLYPYYFLTCTPKLQNANPES